MPDITPHSLTGLAVEIQCLQTSGHVLILFPMSDQYIKMDYVQARRVAEGVLDALKQYPITKG